MFKRLNTSWRVCSNKVFEHRINVKTRALVTSNVAPLLRGAEAKRVHRKVGRRERLGWAGPAVHRAVIDALNNCDPTPAARCSLPAVQLH